MEIYQSNILNRFLASVTNFFCNNMNISYNDFYFISAKGMDNKIILELIHILSNYNYVLPDARLSYSIDHYRISCILNKLNIYSIYLYKFFLFEIPIRYSDFLFNADSSGVSMLVDDKAVVFLKETESRYDATTILIHEIMHIQLFDLFTRLKRINSKLEYPDIYSLMETAVDFCESIVLKEMGMILLDDFSKRNKEMYELWQATEKSLSEFLFTFLNRRLSDGPAECA